MDSHDFSSESNSVFVVKESSTDNDSITNNFEICDDDSVLQFESNDKLKQVESEVIINSSNKSVNNGNESVNHNHRNVSKDVDFTVNNDGFSNENNCIPKETIVNIQEKEVMSNTTHNEITHVIKEELFDTLPKSSNGSSQGVYGEINNVSQDKKEEKLLCTTSGVIQENDDKIIKTKTLPVSLKNKSDAVRKLSEPISITSVKSLKITKSDTDTNKNIQNNVSLSNIDETNCWTNKRSEAWKYFTALNNVTEVQCKLCLKKFHGRGGSSNLLRHLRSQHANEVHCMGKQNKSFHLEETCSTSSVDIKPVLSVLANRIKKKKISKIWKYFTKSKLGVVKCNICVRNIRYHNSTSFLLRHLRLKHFRNYIRALYTFSKSSKPFNDDSNKAVKSKYSHKNLSELILSSVQHPSTSSSVTSNHNSDKQGRLHAIRKTSRTWKYFTKFNSNKTKCNICGSILKYRDGISSNLTRHLRTKHKNIHSKIHSYCKLPSTEPDNSSVHEAITESSQKECLDISVMQPNEVQGKDNKSGGVEEYNDENDEKNVMKIRKYFTKSSFGEVNCNECHQSFPHSRGSTFNLKCHIIMKHENIFQRITDAIYKEESKNFRPDHERRKEYDKIKLHWKYFMKMKSGKLKCNLCPIYCSVTNSLQHLHLKHNIQVDNLEEPSLILTSEFVDVSKLGNNENTFANDNNYTDNLDKDLEEFNCEKSTESVTPDRTWKYFTKIYQDKIMAVKCNLCDDVFSYTCGVILNLSRHLKLVHMNDDVESSHTNDKQVEEPGVSGSEGYDEVSMKEEERQAEFKIKRSNIKKSKITWRYYSLVDENKAKCSFCECLLAFSRRSSTNLMRHLKRKHNNLIDWTSGVTCDQNQQSPIQLTCTPKITEVDGCVTLDTESIQEYICNDKLKNWIEFDSNSIKCKICCEYFFCQDVSNYTTVLQHHMQIHHAEWKVVCADAISNQPGNDPDSCNYNELQAIADEVQSFMVVKDPLQELGDSGSNKTAIVDDLNASQNDTYKNVWKYFTKLTSVNVRCNFCSLVLSYRNNKKWNLYRHLRLKHLSKLDNEDIISADKIESSAEKTNFHYNSSSPKKSCDFKVKQSPTKKVVQSELSQSILKEDDSSDYTSDSEEDEKYNPEKPIFISRVGRTWSHFTKVDMGKATCNICHKKIRYRNTGCDILNKHLQKYHIESSNEHKLLVSKNDKKNSTSENNVSSDNDDTSMDDTSIYNAELSLKEMQETTLNIKDEDISEEAIESNLNKENHNLSSGKKEDECLSKDNTESSSKVGERNLIKKTTKSSSKEVGKINLIKKTDEAESCMENNCDDNYFKTRSKVWTYFTKTGHGLAKCHLCLSQFTYTNTVINLIRHLQKIHSVVSLPSPTRERIITRKEDKNEKFQLLAAIDLAPNNLTESKRRICFTKLDNHIAKCNFCSKIITYKDGSTDNLTSHLQKIHSTKIMNYDLFLKNDKINEDIDDFNESENDVESAVHCQLLSDSNSVDRNMPCKKRSDTWLYYTKLNNDHARCNICSNALSYKGGSVYNLTRHLFIKHDIKLRRRAAIYQPKTSCTDAKMMPKVFNVGKKKRETLSFYSKINRYIVKCKLCSKRFIYKGVNINRLVNHLWSSHITRLIEFNNGSSRSNHHVVGSTDEKNTKTSLEIKDFVENTSDIMSKSITGNIKRPEKGRQISYTWKYFTKSNDDVKARCNICFKHFSYKNGNISNLSRHLLRNHKIKLVKLRPPFKNRNEIKNNEIDSNSNDNTELEKSSLTEIDMNNVKECNQSFSVPFTDLCNKEHIKSNVSLTKNNDEIWKYFVKADDRQVECNVCNKKIPFNENKFNALRNHLLFVHKLQGLSFMQPLSDIACKSNDNVIAEPLGSRHNETLMKSSIEKKRKKLKGFVFRMKCKLCYRRLTFKGNKIDNLINHLKTHEKELPVDENSLLQKIVNAKVNGDNINGNADMNNSDNRNESADISEVALYKYFKDLNLLKNRCKICYKVITSSIHCSHRITNDLSITYGIKRNRSLQRGIISNEAVLDVVKGNSSKALKRKNFNSHSDPKNIKNFMNVNLFENKCGSCNVSLKNKGYCSHSLNQWLIDNKSEKNSELKEQVKIEEELEIITDALSDGENKIIIITDDGAPPALNYDNCNKSGNTSEEVSYHVIGVDGENNDDIQVIIYNFDPEEGGDHFDLQMNNIKIEDESEFSTGNIQPCNKELEEEVKVILQELNNASVFSNRLERKRKESFRGEENPDNLETKISGSDIKEVISAETSLKQHPEESIENTITCPDKAHSETLPGDFKNEIISVNSTCNSKNECRNSFEYIQTSTDLSETIVQKNITPLISKNSNSMHTSRKHLCEVPRVAQEEITESTNLMKVANNTENKNGCSWTKDSVVMQDATHVTLKDTKDADVCNSSSGKNTDENNEVDIVHLIESMEEFNSIEAVTQNEIFNVASGMYLQTVSGLHKINKNLINFSNINFNFKTAKCNICKRFLLFRRPVVYNLMTHLYLKHKNQITMDQTRLDITCDKNGKKILDLLTCNYDNNDCNEVKPRRKSPIWKYFENCTNFRATCKICHFNFSYKGGAVNNLGRHLRLRHDIHVSSKSANEDKNFENYNEEINHLKSISVFPKKRATVKLRSKTWNYFSKEPNDWAKCILCKKYLSYRSSTINNLTRHLRTVHSNVYNSLFLESDNGISSNDAIGQSESNDEICKSILLETTSRSRDEVLQECSYASSERASTKRKSVIWNYFTEVCRDSGRCNFCLKVISCKGGGTSNLARHLRVKHGIWIVLTSNLMDQYEEQFLNASDNSGIPTINPNEGVSETQNETIITHEQLHILKNKKPLIKKSKTWDFFAKETDERVVCKICSKTLSYKSKAVHNLRRHLAIKHPNYLAKRDSVRLKLRINNENESLTNDGLSDPLDADKSFIDITDTSVVIVDEENPPPVRKSDRSSRPKKSFVWNHFDELEYGIAKCNMCNKVLSFRGGGTNNLMRHLRSRHSILTDMQLPDNGTFVTSTETVPVTEILGLPNDDIATFVTSTETVPVTEILSLANDDDATFVTSTETVPGTEILGLPNDDNATFVTSTETVPGTEILGLPNDDNATFVTSTEPVPGTEILGLPNDETESASAVETYLAETVVATVPENFINSDTLKQDHTDNSYN